ncbi:MAG TPA: beta-propeller fold lactonase family protein [Bryobacteraceae bacterium]|jgi:6-phosphogluconolactonase|nr:beta-propeller fold lactonase family protein [Bryobacteraceae bacterium]
MYNLTWRVLLLAAGVSTAASLFGAASQSEKPTDGAVFVMTNDAMANEVISFERTQYGLLAPGDHFRTGGRGSGGTGDPLQSQGSLALSQDHSVLFAANAGSGTVSVFRVNGASLTLLDQADSGGSEPLSIAQSGNFVYVLNGAAAGSVVAFEWDGRKLRQVPNSTAFLSATSAGGSSVTISPDGKTLVITERLTNNIDTFQIHADGTLGPIVVNTSKAPGVFSARFAPDGALLVSETGPANAVNGSSISSYSVMTNGTISAISQSVPTLGAANCWNAVAPNGKWVYVSNAGSDSVSGFTIGNGGTLTPIGGTVLGSNPAGSNNLDIAVSSDSGFVYTLNSGAGAIGMFAIQNDGSLISLGQVDGLPKAVGFNGIAAL